MLIGNWSKLSADKASDHNSVSTLIDADTIKTNASADLQIHCRVRKGTLLGGTSPEAAVYLPFVIPKEANIQYQVNAWLQYHVESTATATASAKEWWITNSSHVRLPLNESKGWDLPTEATIIGVADTPLGDVNENGAQITFQANTVTVSGWLDSASFVDVPLVLTRISKLLHASIYHHNLTPTYTYTSDVSEDSKAVPVQSSASSTGSLHTCLNIPVEGTPGASNVWFEIRSFVDGKDAGRIYESPTISVAKGLPGNKIDQVQFEGCDIHLNTTRILFPIRSAFLPFSGIHTAKRPGYSTSFLM
jgi:hypothetical protein